MVRWIAGKGAVGGCAAQPRPGSGYAPDRRGSGVVRGAWRQVLLALVALVAWIVGFGGLGWAAAAVVGTGPTAASSPERNEPEQPEWIGTDAAGQPRIRLYFFWTSSCPHCRRARPFVEALPQELPWLDLHSTPLAEERPEDVLRFLDMAEALGEPQPGVPAFLFCGRIRIGFDRPETTGAELRAALIACHEQATASSPTPTVTPPQEATPPPAEPVALPVFGTIDPATVSLPLFTVMIAAADAFNPCAFFVLMFLMSLIAHARRRWRMAVVGGIFVLTSGLLYFAFMAAWLNLFLLVGELGWVTVIAAVIAIGLAAVNIKDYFWLGRGVSLGIPDTAKPGLFARMRCLTVDGSWPVLVLGAVTLAVAANTYELLCTAGFPMLFTRVLTLRALSEPAYYGYLALYNLVYVVPLLGIATVFVVTIGSRKLQAREGRMLKLLSGLVMLGLGLALLLHPEWLSELWGAAAILLAAILAAAAIAVVDRWRAAH